MPASPEELLAELEANWLAAGSTSVRPEGPAAKMTEGKAPVNVTVLDHIAKGRQTLAEAAKLAATGNSFAARKAEALRQAQAIRSKALMGETSSVRAIACPYCATYGLLLHKGLARCINRHCAAAGRQRTWGLVELHMARPAQPKGVRRTEKMPRDAMDMHALVRFLKHSAYPVALSTVNRIVKTYELPRWQASDGRRYLYSLSDVLTAHAVHALKGNPSDCAAAAEKPACTGLADLFFSDGVMKKQKALQAKELCEGCPFQEPCRETALIPHHHDQHGVRGAMTAKERRLLKGDRR